MIIKLLAVLHDLYKHFIIYSLRTTFLQLTLTIGGSYLLSWLFRGILISSGYPGLSLDNIFSFLANPVTFLLLIIYLIILALLVFMEFSFLVEMLRYKETPIELGFKRIKTDFKQFLFSISGHHLLSFLAYLLLTIPVLRFFFSSALIERLYIPTFITGELQKTSLGQVGLMLAYILIFYINARFIYTLPLTIIQKDTHFTENLKTSWIMTSGRSFLTLSGLAIISGIISFVAFITSGLLLGIVYLVFPKDSSQLWFLQVSLLSLVWFIVFIASLLIKLASVSYLILDLEQHAVVDIEPSPNRKKSRWVRMLLINCFIALGAFLYNINILSSSNPKEVDIIAHRGFVDMAVENSLEGLKASKKAKADMVEIDVLMTKDQKFVVVHDDNLQRLSGQSTIISQSKAKDIIGKRLRQNGHISQIVSLKTFLEKATKLKMPLLIELKTTKNQKNYGTAILKELGSLPLNPGSKIMSLDLPLIESIEKHRPDIETGHVITFQFGDFASTKVDFYAIEEFSYSNHLAKLAHKRKKELYIWTINDQDDLKTYLQSSVDGIITDYPNKARRKQKHLIENQDYLSVISRLFDLD